MYVHTVELLFDGCNFFTLVQAMKGNFKTVASLLLNFSFFPHRKLLRLLKSRGMISHSSNSEL